MLGAAAPTTNLDAISPRLRCCVPLRRVQGGKQTFEAHASGVLLQTPAHLYVLTCAHALNEVTSAEGHDDLAVPIIGDLLQLDGDRFIQTAGPAGLEKEAALDMGLIRCTDLCAAELLKTYLPLEEGVLPPTVAVPAGTRLGSNGYPYLSRDRRKPVAMIECLQGLAAPSAVCEALGRWCCTVG